MLTVRRRQTRQFLPGIAAHRIAIAGEYALDQIDSQQSQEHVRRFVCPLIIALTRSPDQVLVQFRLPTLSSLACANQTAQDLTRMSLLFCS